MELKFLKLLYMAENTEVLIVPLWNWNFVNLLEAYVVGSSNCTFMELKCAFTGGNPSS